jgi:hypothetical protein
VFIDAPGELRAVFGIHVAQLSAKFGIDIKDNLATILPVPADKDGSESPGGAVSGAAESGERRNRRGATFFPYHLAVYYSATCLCLGVTAR